MRKHVVLIMLAICLVSLFALTAAPALACVHNYAFSPGYWAQHPEAWWTDGITVGGVPYTNEQAASLMLSPVKGDKTYTMFNALVAAVLNDNEATYGTQGAAQAWMARNPLGSGVTADSDAWQEWAGERACNILHSVWEAWD